jgi:hypothetical protein
MMPYDGKKEQQSAPQQFWGTVIFIVCLFFAMLMAIYVSPLGFMLMLWFNDAD